MSEKGDSEAAIYSTAIVIDNGSHACRAGFAGSNTPCATIPTVVGRPPGHWKTHPGNNTDLETCRAGHEAKPKKGELNCKYPIEYGIVTNWGDMELLWHHVFQNELKTNPKDCPILLTEAALNPKANREKTTQIMFEKFEAPAMYLGSQSVLSLYSIGKTTGLVVDCGDGHGLSVPIYEGYVLAHAVMKLPCAGRDLTDLLMRLLSENNNDGISFTTREQREVVRDIKEKLCAVALDFDLQLMATPMSYEKKYVLPDGRTITVGKERFVTPEAMFQPSFLGYEIAQGVQHSVHVCIKKCDHDISKDLCSNILLSGGSTSFPGFGARLEKELKDLLSRDSSIVDNIKVLSSESERCSAWRGGSILAALPIFQDMWITLEDYDEYGPGIVHRKCF